MQSRTCWKMEDETDLRFLSGGPFHPGVTVDDCPVKHSLPSLTQNLPSGIQNNFATVDTGPSLCAIGLGTATD